MSARRAILASVVALACLGAAPTTAPTSSQIDIRRVTLMPDAPQPYKMKDWQAAAVAYDRYVFDETLTGDHLPMLWWDDTAKNIPGRRMFGLPSYIGGHSGAGRHEAINCLAAVLGATLAGIDKTSGKHDYVSMVEQYFVSHNGQNVVLNGTKARAGDSSWYDLWPQVLFLGIADRYPGHGDLDRIMRTSADRWLEACVALGFPDRPCEFDFTGFEFDTMSPQRNGKWVEPDAAAAVAWVQYMAYRRYGDEKYLKAADWCMSALQRRTKNPHYEVLCPLGGYLAARMNAELGRSYDVEKIVNWTFDPDSVRKGWGVIAERWGDADCHGLVGSTTDRGGYAFTMNTFQAVGVLAPVARYDERFARTIGKWTLNAANASRLFYADEIPRERQSCPDWPGDPGRVVPYEGLRKEWKDNGGPYAIGDPTTYWKMPLDFGLYGGSHVGFFAALIRTTDVPMVLQLDLLGTDFFKAPAYPSYLYYNPHAEPKRVTLPLKGPADVYDALTDAVLIRGATAGATVEVPAGGARSIVLLPANARIVRDGSRATVNDVAIDFRVTSAIAEPAAAARVGSAGQ